MTKLEFNFLGDFSVLRDGEAAALPPSKKTRALLAYLSLNARKFRRDYLCELLWEIPDDPRGSLRWSLSKLRKIVDDGDTKRIVADRSDVQVEAADVRIDVLELLRLAGDMGSASTGELETAAEQFQGNFLEGLELSNFHDFHSWCVAERERVLRAQADLLQELVRRYADEPEKALPHARRLVALSPYDEDSRADLIRLLVGLRHAEEAEQQYLLGKRMLKEIGAVSTGALFAARRSSPAPAPPITADAPAVSKQSPRPLRHSTDLIGREDELAALADAYRNAVNNSSASVVMLNGDPGIGKSRIMETAATVADSEGALLLAASAYESETLRPFALWIDALRQKLPDAAAKIFAEKAAENRERLLEGLSTLVEAEAKDGPIVLLFDDMHWCDESSAAAVHFVARMNRDRPVVFVLAGRSGELQDNVPLQQMLRGLRRDGLLVEVNVGPMPQKALLELVHRQAPGADAAKLSRESGGNPLLAIELARAEVEGESGSSLNELVRERLARFDLDGAEILRWAAVLGPLMSMETLGKLTGQDAESISAVLEAAERQAILKATATGLRFSHDLVARGVYNEISPLRRQVMHRRIAELLEESAGLDLSRAADLAHHASQSGDAGLAARAMVSAGRLCLRFFANDEAASLARRGMQLVDALPDAKRICVSIDLREILLSAAPVKDSEALANEFMMLAEQAVDHGELAHARLGYHLSALVRWLQGEWTDALEQSLQSERVVRGGRVEDQIAGMADTAKCLVLLERDLPQADAMLMEADALSRKNAVRHRSLPAGLGMLRFHENRLDEAEELLKEARTLCKAAGDRFNEYQCNEYLVMIDLERKRCDLASERSKELLVLGDKLREGSEGPFARAIAGLCQYGLEGEHDALDKALDELRVADAKHRLAYVQIKAAQMDLENGNNPSAIVRATEALDLATLLQRPTESALARAVLASAYRDQKDDRLAAKHDKAVAELAGAGIAKWASVYIESLS
jgi:DNA-binding SARP family transcriptional activator